MRHVSRIIVHTRKIKNRLVLITAAVLLAGGSLVLPVTVFGAASADHLATPQNGINYVQQPFTPQYVATWTQDRILPSGGYGSVSFHDRKNVLEMGIDSSKQNPVSFYQYEGLQHALPGVAGVKADLYVDGSWLNNSTTPVGVGMWGVGHDQYGNVSAYPIIEFTNAGSNNFTGWRTFNDNIGGWINLTNVPYRVNHWNKLELVYDPSTTLFNIYINGVKVGSNQATGSANLGAVIFDNRNFGTPNSNYTVHWSDFAYGTSVAENSARQCMDGGWKSVTTPVTFKNQGSCVSYFRHEIKANDSKH